MQIDRKFIILSHGRTGSTVLGKALSCHPMIHAYEEVFHGEQKYRPCVNGHIYDNDMDAASFCEGVIFRSPNEYGKRTVGFKMFFFHARTSANDYRVWPYLLQDRTIRVITLLRRNIFDCFVSEQRSKKSGKWYVSPGELVPTSHLRPIFVDPSECKSYLAATIANIDWAKRAFSAHEGMTVFYEELQRDFPNALNRIFSFLGEESATVPLSFERLNTVPHAEGVMNWQQLVESFRFSIFRDFLLADDES